MTATYVAVMVLAIVANALSGAAALLRFPAILPAMARVGVPTTWMRFPIGTLKTTGAAGLLVGLAGVPYVGLAAAIGLTLFFVCAVHTHLLARDYSGELGLALGFLATALAAVAVNVAAL